MNKTWVMKWKRMKSIGFTFLERKEKPLQIKKKDMKISLSKSLFDFNLSSDFLMALPWTAMKQLTTDFSFFWNFLKLLWRKKHLQLIYLNDKSNELAIYCFPSHASVKYWALSCGILFELGQAFCLQSLWNNNITQLWLVRSRDVVSVYSGN